MIGGFHRPFREVALRQGGTSKAKSSICEVGKCTCLVQGLNVTWVQTGLQTWSPKISIKGIIYHPAFDTSLTRFWLRVVSTTGLGPNGMGEVDPNNAPLQELLVMRKGNPDIVTFLPPREWEAAPKWIAPRDVVPVIYDKEVTVSGTTIVAVPNDGEDADNIVTGVTISDWECVHDTDAGVSVTLYVFKPCADYDDGKMNAAQLFANLGAADQPDGFGGKDEDDVSLYTCSQYYAESECYKVKCFSQWPELIGDRHGNYLGAFKYRAGDCLKSDGSGDRYSTAKSCHDNWKASEVQLAPSLASRPFFCTAYDDTLTKDREEESVTGNTTTAWKTVGCHESGLRLVSYCKGRDGTGANMGHNLIPQIYSAWSWRDYLDGKGTGEEPRKPYGDQAWIEWGYQSLSYQVILADDSFPGGRTGEPGRAGGRAPIEIATAEKLLVEGARPDAADDSQWTPAGGGYMGSDWSPLWVLNGEEDNQTQSVNAMYQYTNWNESRGAAGYSTESNTGSAYRRTMNNFDLPVTSRNPWVGGKYKEMQVSAPSIDCDDRTYHIYWRFRIGKYCWETDEEVYSDWQSDILEETESMKVNGSYHIPGTPIRAGQYVQTGGPRPAPSSQNTTSTMVANTWAKAGKLYVYTPIKHVIPARSIYDPSCNSLYDPPPNSCFVAGTKISTPNNGQKNIEDVKVGDEVLSYDIETNKLEISKVLKIVSPPVRSDLIVVKTEHSANKNTFDHPYFTKNKGWCSYKPQLTKDNYNLDTGQLEVGDIVYYYSENELTPSKIISIKEEIGDVQVYNLTEVSNNGNYFANGILVHNKTYLVCSPRVVNGRLCQGQAMESQDVWLTGTGCRGPTTWEVAGLPPGISFSDPTVSGTPTTPGTYRPTYTITNRGILYGPTPGSTTINGYFEILESTHRNCTTHPEIATNFLLPAGRVGEEYSINLQSIGGTGPYEYFESLNCLAGSCLSFGLELSSDGVLSGTPTKAGSAFIFSVYIKDSSTPAPKTTIPKQFVIRITTLDGPGGGGGELPPGTEVPPNTPGEKKCKGTSDMPDEDDNVRTQTSFWYEYHPNCGSTEDSRWVAPQAVGSSTCAKCVNVGDYQTPPAGYAKCDTCTRTIGRGGPLATPRSPGSTPGSTNNPGPGSSTSTSELKSKLYTAQICAGTVNNWIDVYDESQGGGLQSGSVYRTSNGKCVTNSRNVGQGLNVRALISRSNNAEKIGSSFEYTNCTACTEGEFENPGNTEENDYIVKDCSGGGTFYVPYKSSVTIGKFYRLSNSMCVKVTGQVSGDIAGTVKNSGIQFTTTGTGQNCCKLCLKIPDPNSGTSGAGRGLRGGTLSSPSPNSGNINNNKPGGAGSEPIIIVRDSSTDTTVTFSGKKDSTQPDINPGGERRAIRGSLLTDDGSFDNPFGGSGAMDSECDPTNDGYTDGFLRS